MKYTKKYIKETQVNNLTTISDHNKNQSTEAFFDFTETIEWELKIGSDLVSQPLYVCHAPGDPEKIYILEKTGSIKKCNLDGSSIETFFDCASNSIILPNTTEQGLLGMAFHPNYENNGRLFINYSQQNTGHTIIRELNKEVNIATVGPILMTLYQPYTNHNSGAIRFNPKDTETGNYYLYITTGDGGSGGDPHNLSQNKDKIMGKLLRIDIGDIELPFPNSSDQNATIPDQSPNGSGVLSRMGYKIPNDNPFINGSGSLNEIYAYGLRNPWQFTFDSNGDLYLADVGEAAMEEIDIVRYDNLSGSNFGWRCYEGTSPFNNNNNDCVISTITMPVYEYSHSVGFSICGGEVYEGNNIPSMKGYYLFVDTYTNKKWKCKWNRDGAIGTADAFYSHPNNEENDITINLDGQFIVGFGKDAQNELYYCSLYGGVYKIIGSGYGSGSINFNKGWQLIGLPLIVDNNNYQTLFPDSIEGTLYSYDSSGYKLETELIPGQGYWLKFDSDSVVSITGQILSNLEIVLSKGWNLISSSTNSSINDGDNIIIENTLYSYGENGYVLSENLKLEPGKGYWIKTNIAGTIIITV